MDTIDAYDVNETPGRLLPDPTMVQDRIRAVASSLRDALQAVIEAIGTQTGRPVTLSRAVGVDKNLAGRILRAIKERDPFAVAHRLPAPHGLRMFLRAAAKRKVPSGILAEAERAVEHFETLITQEAGDRAALSAMISAWLPEVREQAERGRRQAAFKALSYLLGYQQDTRLSTMCVQPSQTNEDTCDAAYVRANCGVRRLRPGAPVTVVSAGTKALEPMPPSASSFETLGKDDTPSHYVMPQFSSSPLPDFMVRRQGERIRYMLGDGALGANSGVTVVFADFARCSFLRYALPGQREEEACSAIPCVPTKVWIHDIFVRDDVWRGSQPKLTSNMVPLGDPLPPRNSSEIGDPLETCATIQNLGHGTRGINTKDVENYADIMNYVFEKLGWPRERFRVYRLRLEYPILYMAYTVWFKLPPKPGE